VRFGTWNVRSLNKSGSITAVARDLTMYKLDLVGAQKVRWDTGGTLIFGVIIVCTQKKNYQFGTGFLYPTELYQLLRQ
jgi:hypothetical protein